MGAAGIQLSLLVSGTLSARLLGPERRGYVAILVAIPSAVSQLGAVGMSLAATYYLSSGAIGGRELIRLLRRPALWQITLLTVVNAEIVLLYAFVSRAPITTAACVSLVQVPAALFLDYGLAFLLGSRRHGAVNVIRTLNPGLTAAGVVPLFLLHERSVAWVMAVFVATSVISAAIALRSGVRSAASIVVPRSLVAQLGWVGARRTVLAFGRQGYLGYLSPVDSFRLDQLVVGFLLSPRELGFYVVGAAFANAGRLVATNLGLSATSEIAAHADPAVQRRAVRQTLCLTAGILTTMTAVLAIAVIFAIPFFFGAAYRSSVPIAELLLVASWLLSLKRITVDVMRGTGRTRVGTQAEIVNLSVFLAGAAPLGLWLGAKGVALALGLGAAGGTMLLLRGLLREGTLSRLSAPVE